MKSAPSAGEKAERLVYARLRAALSEEYRLYPNVNWIGWTAAHRGLRDGEADLLVAHPERGFLVFEVKSGRLSRDQTGRWWQGDKHLHPDRFEHAACELNGQARGRRAVTPRAGT